MTALHISAHSIVKFLTVQRYILCIYLANFLPFFLTNAIAFLVRAPRPNAPSSRGLLHTRLVFRRQGLHF